MAENAAADPSCQLPKMSERLERDVAEPGFVVVVLEHDAAFGVFRETGDGLEFAFGAGGFEGLAGEVHAEDFGAVEPVLEGVAFDDDFGGVPLADGLEGFVGGRRENVVEGGGLAVRADFAVRVFDVIQELIFAAEDSFARISA